MFIESESQEFLQRFREATSGLSQHLEDLLRTVKYMDVEIGRSLGHIFESAQSAESLSDEAMAFSDETLAHVEEVIRRLEVLEASDIESIQDKLDVILDYFGIDASRTKTARIWTEGQTEELYRQGLNEREILREINSRWYASAIGAPLSQVLEWSIAKVAELAGGETQTPTGSPLP
jgi:hypothetical protein